MLLSLNMDPILFGLIVVVGLNLLIFPVAFKLQTDKLTDITYALSFTALAVYGIIIGLGFRSVSKLILAGLIILWAIRLGGFLFHRVTQLGKDDRFDKIRTNPMRFLRFFMLQGFSSWIISLPFLYRLLQDPGKTEGFANIETIEWVGWLIALTGLAVETIADQQKSTFKSMPGNRNELYTGGLYSVIQFPNYLGEIFFWIGIFIASIPALIGWQWLSVFSPIIIIVLLLFVSGIPTVLKERKRKYGGNLQYQQYYQQTPKILPGIY